MVYDWPIMAKDDKVPSPADPAPPPPAAAVPPSWDDLSGLPALQAIAAKERGPRADVAGLLAQRINTGMAGEGASLAFHPDLAATPLEGSAVSELVDAAVKAKVGPGGAARWLREKYPEAAASRRAAADYS